jgi:hypothetical protein
MLFVTGIGARFKQGSSKRFARLRQVDVGAEPSHGRKFR